MFKKKLFLAVILCNIIVTTQAMELPAKVKLPSAATLRDYFWQGGFAPFVTSTQIDIYLDNKELNPVILSSIVDQYLYRYAQNLYEEARVHAEFGKNTVSSVPLNKAQVLKCILLDYPKVYSCLIVCTEVSSKL